MRNLQPLLSYLVPVKSKVKISQNVVAFSEYMNFNLMLPPGGIHQSKGPQDFVIFNQSQDSSKPDQITTVIDWLKDDP